jgi:hypothetical protein
MESGCRTEAFFITWAGPQAHDSSGRDDKFVLCNRLVISTGVAEWRDLRFPSQVSTKANMEKTYLSG